MFDQINPILSNGLSLLGIASSLLARFLGAGQEKFVFSSVLTDRNLDTPEEN